MHRGTLANTARSSIDTICHGKDKQFSPTTENDHEPLKHLNKKCIIGMNRQIED